MSFSQTLTLGNVVCEALFFVSNGVYNKNDLIIFSADRLLKYSDFFDIGAGGTIRLLQYIVKELAQNAVDSYGWRGEHRIGGPVEVKVYSNKDHDGVIEVRDSGKGMAPEFLEMKLRGEPPSTRPYATTQGGYGIPTSKYMCNTMGITLDLKSKLGVGTIIYLYLNKCVMHNAKKKLEEADA